MMNFHEKNVVLLGGLNGLCYAVAKNLLKKRIANLYIIDCYDNQNKLQELKAESQSTNVRFEHCDLLNINVGDLYSILQRIHSKLQHIDYCINGMELVTDRDLQRTMSMNMAVYLNTMCIMRDIMDRNKGGRGGYIVNLLSNLCLNDEANITQCLINKQMLLCLTESMAQDFRNQQCGVHIMALMPTFDQQRLWRNMDKLRDIGLHNLLVEMTQKSSEMLWWNERDEDFRHPQGYGDYRRYRSLYDDDSFDEYPRRGHGYGYGHGQRRGEKWGDFEGRFSHDEHRPDQWQRMQNRKFDEDLYLEQGQRLGGSNWDVRKMFDRLAMNLIKGMEMGQNGNLLCIGLQGAKNLQNQIQLARL